MGSYTGTVPTFLAGELPDADKFTEVSNFMTAETSVWTSYTPVWSSAATQPVKNNGTLTGRYRRMGKTIDALIVLVCGSTTTYGTGEWRFTLPVTAVDLLDVGICFIFDNGLQTRPGVCHLITTTTVAPDSAGGTCTNTVPQTWTTADQCVIRITYSAA